MRSIVIIIILCCIFWQSYGQSREQISREWKASEIPIIDSLYLPNFDNPDSTYSVMGFRKERLALYKRFNSKGAVINESVYVAGVSISLIYDMHGIMVKKVRVKLPNDTIKTSYGFSDEGFIESKELTYKSGRSEYFEYDEEGHLIFRLNSKSNEGGRIGHYLRMIDHSVNQVGYIDKEGNGVVTYFNSDMNVRMIGYWENHREARVKVFEYEDGEIVDTKIVEYEER